MLIASVNLASKLLPPAINTLGDAFSPGKTEKNFPSGSVSFDKILEAQQLQAKSPQAVTMGDRVSQYLSALPELQAQINPAEWRHLGFEIKANGELTILRADHSRQKVALSAESKAAIRGMYEQMQLTNPTLQMGTEALIMEVFPADSSIGMAPNNRALIWKAT